jgi:hypothetical protein
VIGDLIARADTAKIAVPWLRTAYTHLTRGRIGDREIDGYCFSIVLATYLISTPCLRELNMATLTSILAPTGSRRNGLENATSPARMTARPVLGKQIHGQKRRRVHLLRAVMIGFRQFQRPITCICPNAIPW